MTQRGEQSFATAGDPSLEDKGVIGRGRFGAVHKVCPYDLDRLITALPYPFWESERSATLTGANWTSSAQEN